MQERANPLKAALAADRPCLGLWCSLASPLATEIMAGAGAGWLLIDGEHSPNDLRSVVAQLQVAAALHVGVPTGDAGVLAHAGPLLTLPPPCLGLEANSSL